MPCRISRGLLRCFSVLFSLSNDPSTVRPHSLSLSFPTRILSFTRDQRKPTQLALEHHIFHQLYGAEVHATSRVTPAVLASFLETVRRNSARRYHKPRASALSSIALRGDTIVHPTRLMLLLLLLIPVCIHHTPPTGKKKTLRYLSSCFSKIRTIPIVPYRDGLQKTQTLDVRAHQCRRSTQERRAVHAPSYYMISYDTLQGG